MSSRGTKDERFIIVAYRAAMEKNDPETELDKYEIGQLVGLSPKGTETITNTLAQCNFIKKLGKSEFRLTSNGIALAKTLTGN